MKKLILTTILLLAAAVCSAETIISPYDNKTEMTMTQSSCPIKKMASSFEHAYFANSRFVGCWHNSKANKYISLYNEATGEIFAYTYADLQNAINIKANNESLAQNNFEYNFLKNNPNWGRIPTPPAVQYTPPPVQVQCWNNGFGTVQCGSL